MAEAEAALKEKSQLNIQCQPDATPSKPFINTCANNNHQEMKVNLATPTLPSTFGVREPRIKKKRSIALALVFQERKVNLATSTLSGVRGNSAKKKKRSLALGFEVPPLSQGDNYLLAAELPISTLMLENAHLKEEVAFLSHNGDLQRDQSLWLQSVVQDQEEMLKSQYRVISGLRDSLDVSEFHEKILEIDNEALQDSMTLLSVDELQNQATITTLEGQVASLTEKVTISSKLQETSTSLLAQYKDATASMQALLAKKHKTKLIHGSASVRQTTCETRLAVRNEMAHAKARIRTVEQQAESAYMAKLIAIVDKFSGGPAVARYDPYNPSNHLPSQTPPLHPDHLPDAIPREFFGLWTFLQEPTKAELKIYKDFLLGPPPVLVFVPDPKPQINWSRLNKYQLRNLPDPQLFPILSVPADPLYYTTTYHARYEMNGEGCKGVPDCGCVRHLPPFGKCHGLRTNKGVIAMPTEPVHGYTWDGQEWVLAAL